MNLIAHRQYSVYLHVASCERRLKAKLKSGQCLILDLVIFSANLTPNGANTNPDIAIKSAAL